MLRRESPSVNNMASTIQRRSGEGGVRTAALDELSAVLTLDNKLSGKELAERHLADRAGTFIAGMNNEVLAAMAGYLSATNDDESRVLAGKNPRSI